MLRAERTAPLGLETELYPISEPMCALSDDEALGFDKRLRQAGYRRFLNPDQIHETLSNLRQQKPSPSRSECVAALLYYFHHDAFIQLASEARPLPLRANEWPGDRAFYDELGEERLDTPCRQGACERGAVRFSILCRRHHFESTMGRACPFDAPADMTTR